MQKTSYSEKTMVQIIINAVANAFQTLTCSILEKERGSATIASARQVAMYLAHVAGGMSLTLVGQHFGRDRATVRHACQCVELRRDAAGFDDVLSCLEVGLFAYLKFHKTLERHCHETVHTI